MQVGIERRCEAWEVKAALEGFFPEYSIRVFPSFEVLNEEGPSGDIDGVLSDNRSEFPVLLALVYYPDGPQAIYREQMRLARFLSERLSCRTICDGSDHGDSPSPYWSIVWDRGVSWLADDCNTAFGDGEGGPVRLVRWLEVAELA